MGVPPPPPPPPPPHVMTFSGVIPKLQSPDGDSGDGQGSDDDGEDETKRDLQVAVALEAVEELAGHNSKLSQPATPGNRVLGLYLKNIEASSHSHAEGVRILRRVRRLVQQLYSESSIHAFGSAMNGLGDGACDIDIDVSVPVPDGPGNTQKALVGITDHLSRHGFAVELTALSAKVPVCTLVCLESKRKVDVTVNNGLPVFNTRLLRYYARLYPDGLVRKLVLLVKCWSKHRDVNGAKDKHLSSYALTLMVIFYLQVGFPEPLLPSLQAMAKELQEGLRTWTQDGRAYDVSMVSATTALKNWRPPSEVPDLDTLVRGFFDFYVNRFDFATDLVSVRLGVGSRREHTDFAGKATEHLGGCCWIEDPVETTRNLNCVLTDQTFQVLQSELKLACSVLSAPNTTFAQLIPMPQPKVTAPRRDRARDKYEQSWASTGPAQQWSRPEWPGPHWTPPEQDNWEGWDGWEEYRKGVQRGFEAYYERNNDRSRTWGPNGTPPLGPQRAPQTLPAQSWSREEWDQWNQWAPKSKVQPQPKRVGLGQLPHSGERKRTPPTTPPTAVAKPARETPPKPTVGFAAADEKRFQRRILDESSSAHESASTFAKVMQQLDAAPAPEPQLEASPELLLDPSHDVKEVLEAPEDMRERRLWEKLYNRALFTGCTHRQALGVTENVLRRGQPAALEILKSKTAMSKETAAIRNSRRPTPPQGSTA